MSKPVAKSLHTVTVLVQVARYVRGSVGVGQNPEPIECLHWEHSLDRAMEVLGLDDRDDPYGLRAAALRQLTL